MDNTYQDKSGKDHGSEDERPALQTPPPEQQRTEAELALIHAAMLEELGIGRKNALPLQDSGGPIGNIRALARQASNNPWANAVFDDVDPAMQELDSIADGQLYRLRRGTSNGFSRGFSASAHKGASHRGGSSNGRASGPARDSHSGRGGRGGLRGTAHNVSRRPVNDGRRRLHGQARIDATIARLRATPSDAPQQELVRSRQNVNRQSRISPPSISGSLFSLANSSAEAFMAYASRGPLAPSAPSVSSKDGGFSHVSAAGKEKTGFASEVGLQGSRWNLPESIASSSAYQPAPRHLDQPSLAVTRPSSATQPFPNVTRPAPAVNHTFPAVTQPAPVISQSATIATQLTPDAASPAPVVADTTQEAEKPDIVIEKTGVKLSRADQPDKVKPVTVTVLRFAKDIILRCADNPTESYIYEVITDKTTLFAASSTVTFCSGGGGSFTWNIEFSLPYEAVRLQNAVIPGGRNLLAREEVSLSKPVPESISSSYFNETQEDDRLIHIDDKGSDEPIQTVKPARSALMDLALLMSVENIDGVLEKINSHKKGTLLVRLLDMIDDEEVSQNSSFDEFLNSLEVIEALEIIVYEFFEHSAVFGYLKDEERISFVEDIAPKILTKVIEDQDLMSAKEPASRTQPQNVHNAAKEDSTHYTVQELLNMRDRAASVAGKIVSAPVRNTVVSKPRSSSSTPAFKPATSTQEWQSFSAPEPYLDAKITLGESWDNELLPSSAAVPDFNPDSKIVTEQNVSVQDISKFPTAADQERPDPAIPGLFVLVKVQSTTYEQTDPTLWGVITSSASVADKRADNIKSHLRGIQIGLDKAGLLPPPEKPNQSLAQAVENSAPEQHLVPIKLETPPIGAIKHRPSHSDFDRLATQFNTLEVSGNGTQGIKKQTEVDASTTVWQSTQGTGSQIVNTLVEPKNTPKLGPDLYFHGLSRTSTASPVSSIKSLIVPYTEPVLSEMKKGALKTVTGVALADQVNSSQKFVDETNPTARLSKPKMEIPVPCALPVERSQQINQEAVEESRPKAQPESIKTGGVVDNRNVEKSQGLASSRWASESNAPAPSHRLFSPPQAEASLFQRARPAAIQSTTSYPSIVQSQQHPVPVTPITSIYPEKLATILVPDSRTGVLVSITGIATGHHVNAQHAGFQTSLPTSPLSPITRFPARNHTGSHFSDGSFGYDFKPDAAPFSPRGPTRPPLSPKKENIQSNLQERLNQSMAGRIGSPSARR